MASDIRLADDHTVEVLDAHALVVHAKDLQLDSAERRSDDHAEGPRRALVHNHRDGLTINWDDDYPDGVRVDGHLQSTGSAAFTGTYTQRLTVEDDVRLTRPETWPDLGDPPPGFAADGTEPPDPVSMDELGTSVATTTYGLSPRIPVDPALREQLLTSIDLRHELARLRAEIAHLKQRVTDLERA